MSKLNYLISGVMLATLLAGCQSKQVTNAIQGKVEIEELSVTQKVPGRIQEILVKKGDQVHKGDTLAILDIPEVDAKRSQAQGALQSADAQYHLTVNGATRNQMTQLNAKKAALTEQFVYAQKSLDRLSALVKDSLVPQQSYDEVYAKYQGAKAQLEAVEAEIADVQNGLRVEQQTMALGQKNRALGAIQEVQAAEAERYVIAPADMIIETITLKVGELALPGYTLFKGSLPGSTYFRFTLPEQELNKVNKGDEVTVHSVYAKRDIKAKVTTIKQLSAYANIATAYPDYEIQQSLFEIQLTPIREDEVTQLIAKTTVLLKL